MNDTPKRNPLSMAQGHFDPPERRSLISRRTWHLLLSTKSFSTFHFITVGVADVKHSVIAPLQRPPNRPPQPALVEV
jgi:hypothetical protein